MAKTDRTAPCSITEARVRLRAANAYLESADLVHDEERAEFLSVATGLAVLAGIAASDSICCARLHRRHRGDDHRGAAELLAQATPDGTALSNKLLRLLDVKDEAHYGVILVSARKARDAFKWASQLVKRAGEEVQR